VCPYHAWTFNLDGELVGVPAQKYYLPDLQLTDHRLKAVRTEVWRGLIFICFDERARDLLDYLEEFPEYLEAYNKDVESLLLTTTVTMVEKINWKLIVENYVEDYHFSFVHPQTLKVFDHKATQTLPTGDHIRIFMPYEGQKPEGDCKYPWASGGGSQQGLIWPSMTIQPAINHLSIFQIIPLAPELTRIQIPIFQTPAQQQEFPLDIEKLTADVLQDMEEDFVICRDMQKNTHSKHYKIGALSDPHEIGIHHFAQTWKKYMNGEKE
jgi:phenylpropionate dioxygenase-like ring-hydroxylating dioxygenase large terminal subunit